MNGADEEWVKAAMSDDAMVVELLVRLHHAPPPLLERAPLSLRWSVRQRRSKPVSAHSNSKKPARSHRGSPTTPLSWSGATSFSGGGAGSEESSRTTPIKPSSTSRSKVNVDGEKTDSKRSRRRKTLAELKIEENSLVKERKNLKREMATLRLYVERQRATNGNLKRLKVELQTCLDEESKSAAVTSTVSDIAQKSSTSNPCSEAKSDAKFVLPDLNMPFDDPELLC
ncbi:hypothetical protein STAS_20976 [Striga asiatica]|uniref:BZIP domain-containing protein n=1 Tax=Striga asiatica TaxID=4170 RepID=A0A5A7QGM4_STRAF|nr:hypothetical protein STAS_20976 [Striga asiatica]